MPRRPQGLFLVLERVLKEAKAPLTCVEVWDLPEVRQHAESPNRVSDYLGNLWRKGKARRVPAPRTENNESRYAYEWNRGNEVSLATGTKLRKPDPSAIGVKLLLARPNVEITEEGDLITITLPKLSITIRQTQ